MRKIAVLLILVLILGVCSNVKVAELQRGSREVFTLQEGLGYVGSLNLKGLFELIQNVNLTFYINPDGSVVPEFVALISNETAKPTNLTLKVDSTIEGQESSMSLAAYFPPEPVANVTHLQAKFNLKVERRAVTNTTTGRGYILVNATNPSRKVPLEWLEVEGRYLKAPGVEKLAVLVNADLAERHLSPENITAIGMVVSVLSPMCPMLNKSLYQATNGSLWIGNLDGDFDPKEALIKIDLELVGDFKRAFSSVPYWENVTDIPFIPKEGINITVPALSPKWQKLREKLENVRYVELESLNINGNFSTLDGVFYLVSNFKFRGNFSKQVTEVNRAFIEWVLKNPETIGLDVLIANTGTWVIDVLSSCKELYLDCSEVVFSLELKDNELTIHSKGPRVIYEKDPKRTFPFIRNRIILYTWKGLGLMFKNTSINVIGLASQEKEVKVTLPEELLPRANKTFRGFKLGGDLNLLLKLNVEITKNVYGIANYMLIEKPKGLNVVVATNSTFKDIVLDREGKVEVEVEGAKGSRGCLNIAIYKDEIPFKPIKIVAYSDVPISYEAREFSDGYSIYVSYPHSTRVITIKLLRVGLIEASVDKEEITVPARVVLTVDVKDQFGDPLSNATVQVYLIWKGYSKKIADLITDQNGKATCKVEISEAGDYALKVASNGLSKEVSVKANLPLLYSPTLWISVAIIVIAVAAVAILKMRKRPQ